MHPALKAVLGDPFFQALPKDSIDLLNALTQLQTESDRSVSVVAGAFIDDLLTVAIKAYLIDDEVTAKELFDPGKAAGEFAVKNRLALMLGIYDKLIYDELKLISRIRNEFAHKILFYSFNDEKIRAKIASLKLVSVIASIDGAPSKSKHPLTRKITASFTQAAYDELRADPRELFIRTVFFLVGILTAAKNWAKRPSMHSNVTGSV